MQGPEGTCDKACVWHGHVLKRRISVLSWRVSVSRPAEGGGSGYRYYVPVCIEKCRRRRRRRRRGAT